MRSQPLFLMRNGSPFICDLNGATKRTDNVKNYISRLVAGTSDDVNMSFVSSATEILMRLPVAVLLFCGDNVFDGRCFVIQDVRKVCATEKRCIC